MNKDRPKYKQILAAAVEVIADNGYHASQVSKIAKKAKVADGTIYLYFKNKEDILISVFRQEMGEFIDKIVNSIDETGTASEKLLTLIQTHYKGLTENPHFAIVTQLELRQTNPELRMQINNILKDYLNVIDSIVAEGISNQEIRDDINPRLIRQMIFGILDETTTSWVMSSQRYSLIEQATEVHKLLVSGLMKKN